MMEDSHLIPVAMFPGAPCGSLLLTYSSVLSGGTASFDPGAFVCAGMDNEPLKRYFLVSGNENRAADAERSLK